jgi:hypothetical protein
MARGQVEAFPERYVDRIRLPRNLTLDQVERLRDRIREYGRSEMIDLTHLTMEFEAEDDWDLRTILADVETELHSNDIEFEIDKAKIVRRGDG